MVYRPTDYHGKRRQSRNKTLLSPLHSKKRYNRYRLDKLKSAVRKRKIAVAIRKDHEQFGKPSKWTDEYREWYHRTKRDYLHWYEHQYAPKAHKLRKFWDRFHKHYRRGPEADWNPYEIIGDLFD